jgi:hypothetical protein
VRPRKAVGAVVEGGDDGMAGDGDGQELTEGEGKSPNFHTS